MPCHCDDWRRATQELDVADHRASIHLIPILGRLERPTLCLLGPKPCCGSVERMTRRIGREFLLAAVFLTSCIGAQPTESPATSAPPPSPSTSSSAAARTSPSPVATPTPTRRLLVTPTPLPTSRQTIELVTHENPILGYRITLPEDFRRSSAGIIAGDQVNLGGDTYTGRTEAEEREACLSDAGAQPRLEGPPDLNIGASRDPAGLTAEAWATTPRSPGAQPMSMHMLVERTTVDGREAVRLVRDQVTNHETTAYVCPRQRSHVHPAVRE